MDIVERLRLFGSVSMDEEGRLGPFETNPLTAAAADEIERLRALGDRMAQALDDIYDGRVWVADLIYEWEEARRG